VYSVLSGPVGAGRSEDRMERDKWDELFDEDPYRSLAEDEAGTVADVLPAGDYGVLSRRDGFVEYHEVRVTEPWRPSLVRRDERPRVSAPTSRKPCAHCGATFKGIARAKYCGAEDCTRSRAAGRKARSRTA